jgi:hypothetical protein
MYASERDPVPFWLQAPIVMGGVAPPVAVGAEVAVSHIAPSA